MAREPEWLRWTKERFVAQLGKTNQVRPDRMLVNLCTELRLMQSKLLYNFSNEIRKRKQMFGI